MRTPTKKPSSGAKVHTRTSYFLWSDHVRSTVLADDPRVKGKSMAQVSKVLSQLWRDLPPADKQVFEKQSAELRQKQLESTNPAAVGVVVPKGWTAHTDVASKLPYYTNMLTKRSQWSAPMPSDAMPNLPQKPQTAHMLFVAEARSRNPPPALTAINAEWSALPQEQMQQYKARADAARQQYLAALEVERAAHAR